MSENFPGFAAAQREYDARLPPEDGPSECPDCFGTGKFDLAKGEGVFVTYKTCKGFGLLDDDGEPFDPHKAEYEADAYVEYERDEALTREPDNANYGD